MPVPYTFDIDYFVFFQLALRDLFNEAVFGP